MAKALKRDEVEHDAEPIDLEDDKDEDLAEAVFSISGGAAPGGIRRRRWNEEVERLKEVMIIMDEEVGVLYPPTRRTGL